MKKIFKILSLAIIVCSAVILVACNSNFHQPNNQINVSYEELKTLTINNIPNSWNNISATKTTANDIETIILNKIEVESNAPVLLNNIKSKNINLNFIIENSNEKIYCNNNIRYHKSKTRNYIDESDFNKEQFVTYRTISKGHINTTFVLYFDNENILTAIEIGCDYFSEKE